MAGAALKLARALPSLPLPFRHSDITYGAKRDECGLVLKICFNSPDSHISVQTRDRISFALLLC